MRRGATLAAVALIASAPLAAQEAADPNAPLSAIDWLSQSVEQPETLAVAPRVTGTEATRGSRPTRVPPRDEAPVSGSAAPPTVTVQPLGVPAPRAVGLLAPETTGLPANLWSGSDADLLGTLLMAQDIDTLPALQELVITLAIAKADPALGDPSNLTLLRARVDILLKTGALEQALALLSAAPTEDAALFRRYFDVALLTGDENDACRALKSTPDVAPTPSARVFCLARLGDWSAAALTLNTGQALGDIDAETGALLSRFLDPELFEGEAALTPPAPVTPLAFRMFEAIGEPLTTRNLPRAFSHADLRPNVGWKAQLEAAERLARSTAISPNALVGLYSDRVPSASGGVFERAKAVISLQNALAEGDADRIGAAASDLWDQATPVGVAVPLAQHFAPALEAAEVSADHHDVLFKWLLLSDRYDTAALRPDLAATDPFLAALATGDPSGALPLKPAYPVLQEAFRADASPDLTDLAASGKPGEAILRTLATVQQGLEGDRIALREGLATLRALGLEDVARRSALQYAILP